MAGAGGDNLRNVQPPLQLPVPEIEHFAVPVGTNTEQRLAALETRVGQMAERMGRLEHEISLALPRIINSSISSSLRFLECLEGITNSRGDLPSNFPATIFAVDGLTEQEAIELLQFYELPLFGDRNQLIRRLSYHLGFRF